MLNQGLEKLQNTSEEIKVLQENLTIMKPALEEAAIDANIMIEKIAEDMVTDVSIHIQFITNKYLTVTYLLHYRK